MKIWHRITFGMKDSIDAIIEGLEIKHIKTPIFQDNYLITFEMDESDSRWSQVAKLVSEKKAVDICETIFTNEEILDADWVRIIPKFEQGYPQPKATWVSNPASYENKCRRCGVGYHQVAPFRLAKEPRLGKHDFLCLYWTYTLFCTPRVLEALGAHDIRGYEVWDAIIDPTDRPSAIVRQLLFPHLTGPGLSKADKNRPEACPECGITKYGYHSRGYMHYQRKAVQPDWDAVSTYEWFGSGGHGGHREMLASHRLAALIVEQGWTGVLLKPIILT